MVAAHQSVAAYNTGHLILPNIGVQGAAVSAVQIDGIVHEFTSIPGVREDVTNIVLNLKGLAVRMHAEGPKKLLLRKTGAGPVTGADIEETADVEILNKDHVICTADEGADIRMELTVTTGKGYVPAAASRPEDAPIGLISIDALYSPVKRVAYRVEDTREGQVLALQTVSRTIISFTLVTLSKSPKPKCSVHQTLAVSHSMKLKKFSQLWGCIWVWTRQTGRQKISKNLLRNMTTTFKVI